jgi:hypothetical protein
MFLRLIIHNVVRMNDLTLKGEIYLIDEHDQGYNKAHRQNIKPIICEVIMRIKL